jgi:ATP-dependent Lon protease
MVAERDRMLAEQTATLEHERRQHDDAWKAFDDERTALRQEIVSRDEAIAVRQTIRWWLSVPWRRLGRWLQGR